LDYHWVETGHIQTEYFVRALSWNLEGTRLLLGGRLLQLWHSKCNPETQDDIYPKNISTGGAKFQVGNDGESEDEAKESAIKSSVPKVYVYGSCPIEEGKVFEYDSKATSHEGISKEKQYFFNSFNAIFFFSPTDACEGYELAWEARTATPVRLLCFSPDGTLFATAGMNDPLVKVWYQDKPCRKTKFFFFSKSIRNSKCF
jgi:hypothetical protein